MPVYPCHALCVQDAFPKEDERRWIWSFVLLLALIRKQNSFFQIVKSESNGTALHSSRNVAIPSTFADFDSSPCSLKCPISGDKYAFLFCCVLSRLFGCFLPDDPTRLDPAGLHALGTL